MQFLPFQLKHHQERDQVGKRLAAASYPTSTVMPCKDLSSMPSRLISFAEYTAGSKASCSSDIAVQLNLQEVKRPYYFLVLVVLGPFTITAADELQGQFLLRSCCLLMSYSPTCSIRSRSYWPVWSCPRNVGSSVTYPSPSSEVVALSPGQWHILISI